MKCFKANQGQSLVEVVVAVGAMSILLVALLALVVVSVKNSRLAKDRAKAVALSQGGVELMRAYRDYGWIEFSSFGTGQDYVLDSTFTVETGLGGVATGCDETSYMDETNFFSRCVNLQTSGGVVAVEVTVSWQEGANLQQVVQTTKLAAWER